MDRPQPKKSRVNIDLNHDYITNLPADLREKILLKLPLKQVVKTSILSSKWIDSWTSIPKLVFKDSLLKKNRTKSGFVMLVDQVLLVHQGPIQKFKLVSEHDCSEAIGRWMHILSRNGIRYLELRYGRCNIPLRLRCNISFHLFSCLALERLYLSFFIINVPQFFNGFTMLRTLQLFTFHIPRFGIERLVSSCPLLVRLKLHIFKQQGCLRILAPNLTSLDIKGAFHDIYLETPNLASGCINLMSNSYEQFSSGKHGKESNITRALGRLSNIQKLNIWNNFTDYLAMGPIPKNLPAIFNHLTEILVGLCICSDEIAATLCLFQNAPNLKVLNIEFSDSKNNPHDQAFWEPKASKDCLFKRLEVVYMTFNLDLEFSLRNAQSIIDFVKLVLSTAPMLEKFIVFDLEDDMVISEMLEFPKLSEKCKIDFEETQHDEESDSDEDSNGEEESDSDEDSNGDEESDSDEDSNGEEESDNDEGSNGEEGSDSDEDSNGEEESDA